MLRTALKPVWILALLLALAIAAVFVGLSKWQIDAAETSAPPPLTQTEEPVALTEHLQPERAVMGYEADQVVVLTGQFQPENEVLVRDRLREGESGYWVVTAATVDGAPNGEVIPVVRGWTNDPAVVNPAPQGEVEITGRLLPAEGPMPRGTSREDGRLVTQTVASSELINLWNEPSYTGFVAAFTVVPATEFSTLDRLAAGEEAAAVAEVRQALDIGAHREDSELEPVWVGPQPQETEVVWMNVFYAIEWIVFAGFALFLWWRFVRDDYLREKREEELDQQWAEHWRAEELARRREEARVNKQRAVEEFERYHRRREREAVATARRAHGADSHDLPNPHRRPGATGDQTPPAPEEDA